MDDLPDRASLALILAIADTAANGLPKSYEGNENSVAIERTRRANDALAYADALLAALPK